MASEGGMKAKTIKSIIRRKVDAWLESIEEPAMRERCAKNTIVTGGAIASMLLGENVSDFDIYLRDFDTTLLLAHYYLNRFQSRVQNGIATPLSVVVENGRVKIVVKSAGIASEQGTEKPYQYFEGQPDASATAYVGDVITDPEQIEDTYQEVEGKALETGDEKGKPKFRPIFLSTNAITLSHRVQVVLRFYGEPDQIHENYDFVHCTNYWTSWDNELVLRPAALESLLSRTLSYVGSKYPICSLVRVRKFVGRGWKINAGQLLKMAMQISQLDLSNISVLEDQLTGVDTAYFCQLIERLREKDPEKVDTAYLVEIVDRIF